jgi:pyrroline-5-carboxylate reductase
MHMLDQINIGFIGGGNMGEALVKGLLAAGLISSDRVNVFDVNSSRTQYLQASYGIRICPSISEVAAISGIIVLAVKPQIMPQVLKELHSKLRASTLIISIAAGIPLSALANGLPPGAPVIRVMPNTPALILEGASALSRGASVSDQQMETAMTLFKSVGMTVQVEEKWMDAVTGLSGSGPAYILMILESLIDGGILMGLPRPVAKDLVIQTILGTVKMVQETGKHPAELKDMITSPAGTTIHGLKILEELGVRGALMGAVEAATLRSIELGLG